MSDTRPRFDPELLEEAARIVRETGIPTVHGARDLGISEGTRGCWVNKHRIVRGTADVSVPWT